MLLGSLTMQLVLCTHVELWTRMCGCQHEWGIAVQAGSSSCLNEAVLILLVIFCSQITVFSFMWITSENASAAIV